MKMEKALQELLFHFQVICLLITWRQQLLIPREVAGGYSLMP